jgi:diketogulonate reductase-like aldo/keto reductase
MELDRRRFIAAGALAAIGCGSAATSAPEAARRSAMLTRKIPATDEALPVIGMGTGQTYDVGQSSQERAPLVEVMRVFSQGGGRLVDSSPMYGSSEEVVGDVTAQLNIRPKLFVATKVWTSGQASGVRQMEDSMRKLRVDKLDLMQVHNLVDVHTHLATLAQWKREGRVRYVGVTHYTASAHDEVAKLLEQKRLDFVQINYSAAEREAERRVLEVAQRRGVAVIANRPFAGGGLLSRLGRRPLPSFAAGLECESWAQLLLKFVVSHPAVTCAIPATSKAAHMQDNLKAGFGPMPDATLREKIAEAARA